jgi:hypothetical protein
MRTSKSYWLLTDCEIPYFFARHLQRRPTAVAPEACLACGDVGADVVERECHIAYPGNGPVAPVRFRLCGSCARGFQEISDVARAVFERADPVVADAVRRWAEHGSQLEFAEVTWNVTLPLDVFALVFDARRAFLFGLHVAAIVTSAAAVELALNRDVVLASTGWKNLNLRLLRAAAAVGVPVAELLDEDERVAFSAGTLERCRFITRRNQFAHGEGIRKVRNPRFFIEDIESLARDQLMAAQRFVRAWAASNGNPIVRQYAECRATCEVGKTVWIELSAHASALDVGWFIPGSDGRWY